MPLILFFLAQIADVLTSVIGMSHFNTIEANPIGFEMVLVGKVVVCLYALALWFGMSKWRRVWNYPLLMGAGMVFYVAFENARLWL